MGENIGCWSCCWWHCLTFSKKRLRLIFITENTWLSWVAFQIENIFLLFRLWLARFRNQLGRFYCICKKRPTLICWLLLWFHCNWWIGSRCRGREEKGWGSRNCDILKKSFIWTLWGWYNCWLGEQASWGVAIRIWAINGWPKDIWLLTQILKYWYFNWLLHHWLFYLRLLNFLIFHFLLFHLVIEQFGSAQKTVFILIFRNPGIVVGKKRPFWVNKRFLLLVLLNQ